MSKLLKLGFLDIPENRWLDALGTFEIVHNIVLYETEKNRLENDQIISYFLISDKASFIKRNCNKLIIRFLLDYKELNRFLFILMIKLFRLVNYKEIKEILGSIKYDYCHSSYNDYDNSDLITIVLKPFLTSKIIRSQKETRPEFSRKEKECFALCDTIVFNSQFNLDFFENKYGQKFFTKKEIVLDLDEDWRKNGIWKYPENFKKLSHFDHNKHIVILTGVARSTPNDKRSGARQFYLNIIDELLNCGLHVHLHARFFELDENGVDLYKLLSEKNPKFKVHSSLDFVNDTDNAYNQLASYDYGILHNFINGESVSYFDKYNIPHRFFEYQLANVIPVIVKDQTIVVEQLILEKKCGLVVREYSDILNHIPEDELNFLKVSFKDFISALYNNR